ncbi:MAG: pyridoxamine 5'-phosphate oxidase family protein [Bacteroidetes bacterium]|nr:pyridoxamine 5'-phosphate oxidase family protein [Bacteroidota bacterium]
MAKKFDEISPLLEEFILKQKIFFVGTARSTGTVNLSPKGMDSLRVLGPNKVIWLNLTGSGNETAAHIMENDRMTIMFCAFEGNPLILRLYGKAKVYHQRDKEYQEYIANFPETPGARQIFELDVEIVQTSCGYAVPLMDYKEDRSMLKTWAEKKGEEKIKEYWQEKNTKSLDGFETGIF